MPFAGILVLLPTVGEQSCMGCPAEDTAAGLSRHQILKYYPSTSNDTFKALETLQMLRYDTGFTVVSCVRKNSSQSWYMSWARRRGTAETGWDKGEYAIALIGQV